MKILAMNWQCMKNPLGGGAEIHFYEIFKRIVAKGHNVTLLACSFDNAKSEEVIDGIRVIRHGNRSTFNFTVRKLYKQIIEKEEFDIVIDDVNKISFYSPCFVKHPLLGISHHFFGTSIFRETNFVAGSYVVLSEWLMKFFYKKTPFVVVSQSTLDDFKQKGFDVSNFSIVYNAIDRSSFPFELQPKTKHPTIVYFGRLKKYKSIDHLFYAFANILKLQPDAELKIMGKGDYRESLEKLAVKLKIQNNVKFLGFVSEKDKAKELTSAWVMVNTSLKEGWGITNIETNACGTPVISADVPGLRDSVKDGMSGLLYKYGNIDELTIKINNILQNNELRTKLSLGAIEWANNFSWDTSAEQMLTKCQEVIQLYKK